RKTRMHLDQRPLRRHRRARHVGHELHRVRVADGKRGELDRPALHVEPLERGRRRLAHVDAHFAVGLEARADRAAEGLDADLGFAREAAAVHELHEAARAVAALLDLPAVGIEDAVAKVRAAGVGRFDHQDLVAADAEVAVGDLPQLGSVEPERLAGAIENHEIVPRALHLGEWDLNAGSLHAAARTQAAMRSIDASSSSGWIGSESTLFAIASDTGSDTPLATAS